MRRLLCLCVLLSGCVGVVAGPNGSVDEQLDTSDTDGGDDTHDTDDSGDPAGGEDSLGGGDASPVVPGELRISPQALTLRPGTSARFAAHLAGENAVAVQWTVTGGTIDAEGNYEAPESEGTFQIVATSDDDDSLTAQAVVTVAEPGGCDNLPAPGVWENVTPPGTTSGAVNGTAGAAVVVDPFDSQTVWLGTSAGTDEMWRSDDCGGTWTQINTGPGSVGGVTPQGVGYGGVGDGAQWSMMVDPVTPNVIYATSGYGAQGLWKTTDGGYSWTDVLAGTEYDAVTYNRFVNNVSLDPTDHLHLLVTTHGPCLAPYEPSCIAETFDGGETWRVFTAPEGWWEGGGLIIIAGSKWVWCGHNMLMTDDSGEHWHENLLAGGGTCEAEYTIRPFTPTSTGVYYLGSRAGVIRSYDGWSWEHVPGTSGLLVMMAQGSTRLFAANQWFASLRTATLADDETWTDLPTPSQISLAADGGIPFLAYDDVHNVLYASLFRGGVARMVIEE